MRCETTIHGRVSRWSLVESSSGYFWCRSSLPPSRAPGRADASEMAQFKLWPLSACNTAAGLWVHHETLPPSRRRPPVRIHPPRAASAHLRQTRTRTRLRRAPSPAGRDRVAGVWFVPQVDDAGLVCPIRIATSRHRGASALQPPPSPRCGRTVGRYARRHPRTPRVEIRERRTMKGVPRTV